MSSASNPSAVTAPFVAGAHHLVTAGDLGHAVDAFVQALERDHLSPNTIAAYARTVSRLAEFLAAHGYPTDVRHIAAPHLDEWLSDVREHERPAIAHSRFRG